MKRSALLLALVACATGAAATYAGSTKTEASYGIDAIDAGKLEPLSSTIIRRVANEIREREATIALLAGLGLTVEELQAKIDQGGAAAAVVTVFQMEVIFGPPNNPFARGLANAIASNDPFVAFNATIENTSSSDLIFSLRGLQPLIPLTGATFARNYLEVGLNDADGDGTASLRQSFGLGNRLQDGFALEDGTGQLRFIGNQLIGDDIIFENGETRVIGDGGQVLETFMGTDPATILFDTGVVEGPAASDLAPLVTMFTTTEFVLSAGDSVTLRGGVLLADSLGLMPDPDLINAFLASAVIPSPGATALLLLAAPISARRRR